MILTAHSLLISRVPALAISIALFEASFLVP